MSKKWKVAVLLGSLRKASITERLAAAVQKIAPPEMEFQTIPIGQLPLYNPDLEENAPEQWRMFREHIRQADAVLFITPEYNRSVPAALKNAIDVGSRPMESSVWRSKPAAVISHSPGLLGGFGAHHHLRQSLACLGMPTLPTPEAYLSHSAKLLDEQGQWANAETRAFLSGFMQAFTTWIASNSRN